MHMESYISWKLTSLSDNLQVHALSGYFQVVKYITGILAKQLCGRESLHSSQCQR